MSTDLQDIMSERAGQTTASRIDLDAVLSNGDRRRRHRGYAVGAGATAAVLGAGFAVASLGGGTSSTTLMPAADLGRDLSWSTRSAIHHGAQTLDVSPHTVHTYVQTDAAFVFSQRDGAVYLANDAGVEEIGNGVGDGGYLRAEHPGSHVAWIDSDGPLPELVVYDTAGETEVLRESTGFEADMGTWRDDDPAFVFAVDGAQAYVRDAEGLARWDIATGERTLMAEGVGGFDVADVADGLIAHQDLGRGEDGNDEGMGEAGRDIPFTMLLGPDLSGSGEPIPASTNDLSPDARYAVTDHDDTERIFEVATGAEVTPSTRYPFSAVASWTGGDSVALLGLRRGQIDLLDCDLVADSCSVVAEDLGQPGVWQVPDGEHLEN